MKSNSEPITPDKANQTKASQRGVVKINVDAAFNPNTKIGKIALVIDEDHGKLQIITDFVACENPAVAELLAIESALIYVEDHYDTITRATIYSDCEPVVGALKQISGKLRPMGYNIKSYFTIFSLLQSLRLSKKVDLVWISREHNKLADFYSKLYR